MSTLRTQEPAVRGILVEHAWRGVRIQVLLRCVLAAFVLVTVLVLPPASDAGACRAIAVAYAAWAVAGAVATRLIGRRLVSLIWLALLVDVLALTAVSLVASLSDQQSWTADVLVTGFFLVPAIAATQLRPWVCVAVVVPTVVAFFGTAAAARTANTEPWSSVLLRTAVLAGVGLGCVLLSRVQRSRVLDIGALAADRARLLVETAQIEERERRALAEHLHDGALQYVLAARHDLEDLPDPDAIERIEHALRESSQLLRSTLTELHPAVLEQAGLPAALRELTARGPLETTLTVTGWPADLRTSVDPILFATARELLTNVAKHAHATRVDVELSREGDVARLVVADDGIGLAADVAERRLAEGHIGLASRRIRLESLGGSLRLSAGTPSGTRAVAEVRIPARTDTVHG